VRTRSIAPARRPSSPSRPNDRTRRATQQGVRLVNGMSVVDLQRTAGNHAVQRLVRAPAPLPVQRKARRRAISRKAATKFVDRLLASSVERALDVIAVTDDVKVLELLLIELDTRLKKLSEPAEAQEHADRFLFLTRWVTVRTALANRVKTLEAVEKIVAIARAKGRGLDPADAEVIKKALEGLPDEQLKEIEKEVNTWPKRIAPTARQELTELVTGPLRLSDLEEAERGRFEAAEGAKIKAELVSARKAMAEDHSMCLDFLMVATGVLFSDEQAVKTATTRYGLGVAGRKDGLHSEGTLSRLAGELRLQGVLGPVRLLPWKGSPERGRHEGPAPEKITPEKLLTALSSAGAGWYFFQVNMFGHHTRLIAVEVADDGAREFVLMEHLVLLTGPKPAERNITGKVNESFDEFGRPDEFAPIGSRVWQVYVRPHTD
jgi:hypothetical protein